MQILESTSTKLAIYSRPISLWLLAASMPTLGCLFAIDLILQSQPFSNKVFSLFLIILWVGLASCAALDLVKVVQCTLDKRLGIVTVREKGLFNNKIVLRSLSEIKDVLIDKENSNSLPVKPVSLVFSSGEKLPVYMQLELDNCQAQAKDTADLIRGFLNLT